MARILGVDHARYVVPTTGWILKTIFSEHGAVVLLAPPDHQYAGMRWDFPIDEIERAEQLVGTLLSATGAVAEEASLPSGQRSPASSPAPESLPTCQDCAASGL